MVYYYLDIETHSAGEKPNPETDKILTVTICAIDAETGKRLQDPVIMKSWEQGEESLVKSLAARMIGKNPFDFVPVGFGVLFDLWFLRHKFKKYTEIDLGDKFYLERPYIDLKHVGVLANKGQFKGVKLAAPGNPIKDWYESQNYPQIELYVLDKLERFLAAYEVWVEKLRE